MEQHFSEMFDKIKDTEKTLEENLKTVETKVYGDVKMLDSVAKSGATAWLWPFIALLIIVSLAGSFFVYMYHKATKHAHYL